MGGCLSLASELAALREGGGRETRTLEQRVRDAADRAGGRRGLARRTRETYAGWVGRFARSAGDARSVMDEGKASQWLSWPLLPMIR
jgi:hypothetical protein